MPTDTYEVFRGTKSVWAAGLVYAEETARYGPIGIKPDTRISSAQLRYTVKPDSFPTAAGFTMKVNGGVVATESWDMFSGATSRGKTVPISLSIGDNYIDLYWNIVFVIPFIWTTNFDTDAVLVITYEGSKPYVPISFEDYMYYGLALGAVAVAGVLVVKALQTRKKG